jgi:hypothetical protein
MCIMGTLPAGHLEHRRVLYSSIQVPSAIFRAYPSTATWCGRYCAGGLGDHGYFTALATKLGIPRFCIRSQNCATGQAQTLSPNGKGQIVSISISSAAASLMHSRTVPLLICTPHSVITTGKCRPSCLRPPVGVGGPATLLRAVASRAGAPFTPRAARRLFDPTK